MQSFNQSFNNFYKYSPAALGIISLVVPLSQYAILPIIAAYYIQNPAAREQLKESLAAMPLSPEVVGITSVLGYVLLGIPGLLLGVSTGMQLSENYKDSRSLVSDLASYFGNMVKKFRDSDDRIPQNIRNCLKRWTALDNAGPAQETEEQEQAAPRARQSASSTPALRPW